MFSDCFIDESLTFGQIPEAYIGLSGCVSETHVQSIDTKFTTCSQKAPSTQSLCTVRCPQGFKEGSANDFFVSCGCCFLDSLYLTCDSCCEQGEMDSSLFHTLVSRHLFIQAVIIEKQEKAVLNLPQVKPSSNGTIPLNLGAMALLDSASDCVTRIPTVSAANQLNLKRSLLLEVCLQWTIIDVVLCIHCCYWSLETYSAWRGTYEGAL